MLPLIEKYLASNMTQKQFYHSENLTLARFKYWLKKYRQTHQAPAASAEPPAPTPFVAIHAKPPTTPNSACEIAYPNGVVLRLSQPTDARLLIQLIHSGA